MRIRYKDYGIVLITNIMCSLVIFIYNIYMRRCIQPYDIGIYTSINLIITYLGYAQLGVLNAYNRDYPQYLGSNQHNKEVIHLRNVVFTYILLLYGFIVLIFGIAGYAYKDNNELYGQGLLFVGVIAFGNSLFTFFDFTLKSEKQFVRGAFIYLFKTIVLFCSGLVLLKKFGYLGIYLALLVSIICMFVLNIPLILKLRIRIDFVLIKSLILSGITLLLNNLVWTLMQSIDRFVILNFMDMEQLGIYSVALLGFSTMVLIPQSLSQIFYVKMSRLYGQLGDRDELMNSASRFTAITGIVTALAAVVAYFLLPLFIKNIMPMYADCVKATQIIVLGVAIYGSTMLYGNILSILKKNRKLMTSTAFLCCINFGLSSLLVLIFGRKIENVAIGTSVSYCIYAVYLLKITVSTVGGKFGCYFKKTVFPVFVTALTLLAVDYLSITDLKKLILGFLLVILEILILYFDIFKEHYINRRK